MKVDLFFHGHIENSDLRQEFIELNPENKLEASYLSLIKTPSYFVPKRQDCSFYSTHMLESVLDEPAVGYNKVIEENESLKFKIERMNHKVSYLQDQIDNMCKLANIPHSDFKEAKKRSLDIFDKILKIGLNALDCSKR